MDSLIPLYAIGVFTGFTMAGAGMAKYHLTHREDHWRRGLAINGTASVLSFIVLVIIAVAKFSEGAWVILIILPLGVFVLLRLHRQYVDEEHQLEEGAAEAAAARVLNRHIVVVLVDRLDMATARALQYARTFNPDELRAVHFTLDSRVSAELVAEWSRLGLARLPLDVVECEDRRLGRAVLELAAEVVADNETELTILLPRRGFATGWHRLLHDGTADRIAAAVAQLHHVNATVVPYQLTGGWFSKRRAADHEPTGDELAPRSAAATFRSLAREGGTTGRGPTGSGSSFERAAFGGHGGTTTPIGQVQWRQRVRMAGRVISVRTQPRAGTREPRVRPGRRDRKILLVFQGRRQIAGIEPGARLVVEGMVGEWARRQAILNPAYELVQAGPEQDRSPSPIEPDPHGQWGPRRDLTLRPRRRPNCPPSRVANVPPGPAGCDLPGAPRPRVTTSNATVLSAAAPHGGGRLHPLPARRTGTERAHRE